MRLARIGSAALAGCALFFFASRARAQPTSEPPPLPPPTSAPPPASVPPTPSSPPSEPTAPPPNVTVTPGLPPPGARQAPGRRAPPMPPPVDESGYVTVTIESDAPSTYLEALVTRDALIRMHWRWHTEVVYGRVAQWHPVCAAPCTIRVPPDLRYRVAGPRVPASDDFVLGPPGAQRKLRVAAGSRAGQGVGAVLLIVGIPTALIGAIVAASASDSGGRDGGYVTLGVGAGLTIAGAVLVGTNGTTVYDGAQTIGGVSAPALATPIAKGLWLTPYGLAF